jgi:hypothetical protein
MRVVARDLLLVVGRERERERVGVGVGVGERVGRWVGRLLWGESGVVDRTPRLDLAALALPSSLGSARRWNQ